MDLTNKLEIMNFLFDNFPYIFWKDSNGVYLGANHNQIKFMGLSSMNDFIGKTIFNILNDQESAQLIHDTDTKIMEGKTPVTIEETIKIPSGETRTYLTQKFPIITDSIVHGLIGFSLDISKYYNERQQLIAEQLEELFKFRQMVGSIANTVKTYQLQYINDKTGVSTTSQASSTTPIILTTTQEQILFLLLLGKNPQQIADIILRLCNHNISATTISKIIHSQLFTMFQVKSLNELIDKATILNIIPVIPQSFSKIKKKKSDQDFYL